MSKLSLIIKHEYLNDIKQKSFWISTFLVPILCVGFGVVMSFLLKDSDAMSKVSVVDAPEDDMTIEQIFGMLISMFLTLFLMIYGAQIFNKVKIEKCNRIVEVISACVEGRTMMLAKIVSVGLIGLTQIFLWLALAGFFMIGLILVLHLPIELEGVSAAWIISSSLWSLGYFIAGYVFYASIFATIGAMTDKNNENQEYLTIVTFILLGSFYLGIFAVDNAGSTLTNWCSFIPFTSPTVSIVNVFENATPIWFNALSLLVLIGFAALVLMIAGKIYTSSLLLRGKKITPKDIITFLKSK